MFAVSTIYVRGMRSLRGKLIAEDVANPVRLRWQFGVGVLLPTT